MSRLFCGCALFFVVAAPCLGQQTAAKPELLISLSVMPAAEPKPALKYLLLPELKEMNPGNPVEGYLKCVLEQYRFVFDEEAFARRKTLLAMPLEDLSAIDEREERPYGGFALQQVDAAARLDKPDFQILQKLKSDGFGTLLPDIQAIRSLGRALGARFKAEVATGRIDDGLRTAKTMFAMSRHLGEHPTLIGNLVGIAIASTAIEPLEQMLEHNDCPNLYWALSYLPYPLIAIKTGMEGERVSIYWFTQDLSGAAPMSAEQITKIIARVDQMMGDDNEYKTSGGLKGYLARRTNDAQKMAAVRKRLIESGLPQAVLAAFPLDQIVLLDEEREMRVRFDEIAKLMVFPAWQFEVLNEKVKPIKKEDFLLAYSFLPAQTAVRWAQARIEQRIAELRTVEALRIYAAEHNGTFPTKLSDSSVPVPFDPVTGKPFRYEVSGKTAHVRSTPPKERENDKYFNVHYEITLKN